MTTYPLREIRDLLTVPLDRREACLRDLLYGLQLVQLALGSDAKPEALRPVMEWTDDGDHSATILTPDGEPVLSLKVEKAGD